jgi:methionyl-tRNA formyltransferase
MRIVIAGTGRLGLAVMEPLLETDHEIVGVIVNGQGKTRLQKQTIGLQQKFLAENHSPQTIAVKNGIPIVWLDEQNEDEIGQIKQLKSDLIITCGFSIILKKSILSIPESGCVNVHSSLLPKHRGASPFAYVILNGDTESGVTWHTTTPGIDAGPILAQQAFPVNGEDTGLTVYKKSCETARLMAVSVLHTIENEGLNGTVQNDADATYDPRMTEERALLDWKKPAIELERLIRATLAYHHAWFYDKSKKIFVTKAKVVANEKHADPGILLNDDPPYCIACGSQALSLESVYYGSNLTSRWPSMFRQLKQGELIQ